MKTKLWTRWMGICLFSLSVGCGSADSSTQEVSASVLAAVGSDVSGEQLALPDGDGAGAKDKPGRCAVSELDHLKELLDLSSDQVTQIQPILDATRTALQNIRDQVNAGTLSHADAQAQVKALHDQQRTQILALLTPEQQSKWTQMRDHHRGPFDIAGLAKVLGLSAEQSSQIETLSNATQTKINDVHAQVEAGSLSKDDAHTRIGQILSDTKNAISAVLTPAQQSQLEQILAHSGPGQGGPLRGPGPGAPPPPQK